MVLYQCKRNPPTYLLLWPLSSRPQEHLKYGDIGQFCSRLVTSWGAWYLRVRLTLPQLARWFSLQHFKKLQAHLGNLQYRRHIGNMKTSLVGVLCIALLSLALARQRKAEVNNEESHRQGKCELHTHSTFILYHYYFFPFFSVFAIFGGPIS